jgi:hypothetical protein
VMKGIGKAENRESEKSENAAHGTHRKHGIRKGAHETHEPHERWYFVMERGAPVTAPEARKPMVGKKQGAAVSNRRMGGHHSLHRSSGVKMLAQNAHWR